MKLGIFKSQESLFIKKKKKKSPSPIAPGGFLEYFWAGIEYDSTWDINNGS